jgi:hypothetical protein
MRRIRLKYTGFFLGLLLFSCFSIQLFSQVQTPKPEKQSAPTVQVTDRPTNLFIDTKQKEIRINCKLAMTEGILEFFLVDEKGRTYESVFKTTDSQPSELHFALLLLGFEPIPFKEYADLSKNTNALEILAKKKCLLKIELRHKQKDKPVPLSALLNNREVTPAKTQELYWVFTGAPFDLASDSAHKYTADHSDVYIGIWPELYSVINLFSDAGNPYRGNLGYEMAKGHGFNVDDEFIILLKGVH